MSANEKYEAVLVFSVLNGEEPAKELEEKFKAMIEANGTVDSVEEWGKRKLAYPINDEEDGYYVLVNFQSATDFPAELDRVLHITDGVLRSLIVKRVEMKKATEKPAEKPAEAAAEAAAEETEENA